MEESPMTELFAMHGEDISACAAPVTSHVARVFGHRVRYLAAGEGEPVLLLHGLADTAESWRRVLPVLGRRYRVIAPDLLGCGLSDKPTISYHLWALATYTRHLMDALGIERAHIVGHSLGGALALHLYFQYPERVTDLTLIASGGMGRQLPWSLRLCTLAGSSSVLGAFLASRHTQHPLAQPLRAVLRRLWPATDLADDSSAILLAGHAPRESDSATESAMVAAEEGAILDRLRDPATRAAFLAMLRSGCDIRGQRGSAIDLLGNINVPVLLIHGERDATIPVSHSRAAYRALKRATLEIIDSCGHCPQREAPACVLRALDRFLVASTSVVPQIS
jgi:pimeloyl-ACP methyl ester carboxylesterase